MADSTFLTTEEVAKLLNVHSNTVARWIKSGKLPSTKIGRDYRIPRDAIENRVNRVAQKSSLATEGPHRIPIGRAILADLKAFDLEHSGFHAVQGFKKKPRTQITQ